jgi:sugar phosphate permease
LREEFSASKEEIGRIASAGTLAYALGKMLLCPLVDQFGGRRGFVWALAAVVVFGALGAFAPSLGALALIYSLNRFGAAASWASMIKQIPPWFGAPTGAFALAVLSLSYVFGGVAAVAFAGQVSEWSGQSWRAIMGVPALLLLALLAGCALLLPRDDATVARTADGHQGFSWPLVRELLALRGFWIVCALSFTLTLLRETFNDWTVDFIKTEGGAGLSTRVAAFLSRPSTFVVPRASLPPERSLAASRAVGARGSWPAACSPSCWPCWPCRDWYRSDFSPSCRRSG